MSPTIDPIYAAYFQPTSMCLPISIIAENSVYLSKYFPKNCKQSRRLCESDTRGRWSDYLTTPESALSLTQSRIRGVKISLIIALIVEWANWVVSENIQTIIDIEQKSKEEI